MQHLSCNLLFSHLSRFIAPPVSLQSRDGYVCSLCWGFNSFYVFRCGLQCPTVVTVCVPHLSVAASPHALPGMSTYRQLTENTTDRIQISISHSPLHKVPVSFCWHISRCFLTFHVLFAFSFCVYRVSQRCFSLQQSQGGAKTSIKVFPFHFTELWQSNKWFKAVNQRHQSHLMTANRSHKHFAMCKQCSCKLLSSNHFSVLF